MKIYHDRSGIIIGICKDNIELGGRHIKLPDRKVAKDFLSTHLSGKYTVSAAKLKKGKAPKKGPAYFKTVNAAVEERLRQLIGEEEFKKIVKKRTP
ncbi:MAG: hypothetical protein PVF97_00040 [Desulfobacterales bacterium]|jgi:hypothetical protein